MNLKAILKTKNNKSELIRFLKDEENDSRCLIDGATWSLRNCKFDYFYLIHNKIYNQYNNNYEFVSEYFLTIINVAAKYNKFDIYKMLFNDPKFSQYIDQKDLIKILSNCLSFHRLFSFSIANSNLGKEESYELIVNFLSHKDFPSIKSAEKIFKVLTKKYKIDFNDIFSFVEREELFYNFNYGYYWAEDQEKKISLYDFLMAFDKKNVFFNSLDKFSYFVGNGFIERYQAKVRQIKIHDKVECF